MLHRTSLQLSWRVALWALPPCAAGSPSVQSFVGTWDPSVSSNDRDHCAKFPSAQQVLTMFRCWGFLREDCNMTLALAKAAATCMRLKASLYTSKVKMHSISCGEEKQFANLNDWLRTGFFHTFAHSIAVLFQWGTTWTRFVVKLEMFPENISFILLYLVSWGSVCPTKEHGMLNGLSPQALTFNTSILKEVSRKNISTMRVRVLLWWPSS